MPLKKKSIKNYIINSIIKCGKKSLSEKLLLKTFKEIQKHTKKNTKQLVKLAIIKQISIISIKELSNKKFRRRSKLVSIPYIIKSTNRIGLAVKLLTNKFSSINPNNYTVNLKNRVIDSAIKKNENENIQLEKVKTAFFKKKFAHFRWFT